MKNSDVKIEIQIRELPLKQGGVFSKGEFINKFYKSILCVSHIL